MVFSLGFAATLVVVGIVAAKVGEKVLDWLAGIWMIRLQIATSLLIVGMGVILSFWNREMYNALQDKNWRTFVDLLFLYHPSEYGPFGIMPGFCEVAAVYILIGVYRVYLTQWLEIRWRRWLTRRYLD